MGKICDVHVAGVGDVKVWLNSNDHCDPHVHCADHGRTWEGRVYFSFLNNIVVKWDCSTPGNNPGNAAFSEIARFLSAYLRKCRSEWWRFQAQRVGCCLANILHSDVMGNQRTISTADYDPATNVTELTFTNGHKRRVDL